MTPTVTIALGPGDNAVRIIGTFVTSFHKLQDAPRPNSRVVNIKGSLVPYDLDQDVQSKDIVFNFSTKSPGSATLNFNLTRTTLEQMLGPERSLIVQYRCQ